MNFIEPDVFEAILSGYNCQQSGSTGLAILITICTTLNKILCVDEESLVPLHRPLKTAVAISEANYH
jgi:hypothetical protein